MENHTGTELDKHNGQIVEYRVRRNGYSITDLGTELNVNRRTIYNFFQNKYLKQNVIYKIGMIIKHDFSKEFPELFTAEEFIPLKKTAFVNLHDLTDVDPDRTKWKDKYLSLLESYNNLLLEKVSLLFALGLCLLDLSEMAPSLIDF